MHIVNLAVVLHKFYIDEGDRIGQDMLTPDDLDEIEIKMHAMMVDSREMARSLQSTRRGGLLEMFVMLALSVIPHL